MRKSYNYTDLLEGVKAVVRDACFAPENKFTNTVWDFHILPVVKHSLLLGEKLKADLEVLEVSAYLHDLAGLIDYEMYPEHHIHGANIAEKMLSKTDFPEEKIKLVGKCIMNHRGSHEAERNTIEEQIVASADAMSHITELADMFYLTYGVRGLKTSEGAVWLKNKLERSWHKIMPEGKAIVQEDFDIANKLLNKAII